MSIHYERIHPSFLSQKIFPVLKSQIAERTDTDKKVQTVVLNMEINPFHKSLEDPTILNSYQRFRTNSTFTFYVPLSSREEEVIHINTFVTEAICNNFSRAIDGAKELEESRGLLSRIVAKFDLEIDGFDRSISMEIESDLGSDSESLGYFFNLTRKDCSSVECKMSG